MDLGTFIHIERNLEKYLDQRYVYLKEKKKKKEKKNKKKKKNLIIIIIIIVIWLFLNYGKLSKRLNNGIVFMETGISILQNSRKKRCTHIVNEF